MTLRDKEKSRNIKDLAISAIGKLPRCHVSNSEYRKRDIPCIQGIYFIMTGDECVYIGRARNVRTRLSTHVSRFKLRNQKDTWIAWAACNGYAEEKRYINLLTPRLNIQIPRWPCTEKDYYQDAVIGRYLAFIPDTDSLEGFWV